MPLLSEWFTVLITDWKLIWPGQSYQLTVSLCGQLQLEWRKLPFIDSDAILFTQQGINFLREPMLYMEVLGSEPQVFCTCFTNMLPFSAVNACCSHGKMQQNTWESQVQNLISCGAISIVQSTFSWEIWIDHERMKPRDFLIICSCFLNLHSLFFYSVRCPNYCFLWIIIFELYFWHILILIL